MSLVVPDIAILGSQSILPVSILDMAGQDDGRTRLPVLCCDGQADRFENRVGDEGGDHAKPGCNDPKDDRSANRPRSIFFHHT